MVKKKITSKPKPSTKKKSQKKVSKKKPVEKKVPVHHKHDKKKVLIDSLLLHLIGYVIIAIVLNMVGMHPIITLSIILVLLWGFFVMSYAYYYHK